MVKLIRARANGGHKIHLVNVETRTSLCGHKPTNTRGTRMHRAKWMNIRTFEEAAGVTCKKCKEKGQDYVE